MTAEPTTEGAERSSVLGVLVHEVEMGAALASVMDAARDRRPYGVTALAVHGVMEAVDDPELLHRINDLELVVPDGQPVRWALNWLYGSRLDERVYGPDLMNRLCAAAAREGLPIYLFGSTPDTLAKLHASLTSRYPGLSIAGAQPSRFRPATEEERRGDLEAIGSSGARMVFVGLGCPRQEIWTFENRIELNMPAIAVGAAFDYAAGNYPPPPPWMQRRGLEWLYRLFREPKRLWRRYLVLNPRYLANLVMARFGWRRLDPTRAVPPGRPIRPG